MANAVITLSPPQDYDLRSLAETTRQSLQLLKPWTLLQPQPNDALVGEITTQAAKYVSAIQMGVSAAYSGFTVTEEVLFLANAFPIEDKEDLQRYLVGMMELAKEAKENANNAYKAFRNVRGEIFAMMEKVKRHEEEEQDGTGSTPDARKDLPRYNKKDLDTLMKFAEHISKFANWWDWVKVETDPSHPDQPLSFQLDTLQDPEVVKRWSQIRQQYTAYVQMIGEIEDSDPQFFNRTTWTAGQRKPSADTRGGTKRPTSPGASEPGAQEEAAPLPPKNQAEPGVNPEKTSPSHVHAPETQDRTKAKQEKRRRQTYGGGLSARFKTTFKGAWPKVARLVFRDLKDKAHSLWTARARRRATQSPGPTSCRSSTPLGHPNSVLSPTEERPGFCEEPGEISDDFKNFEGVQLREKYLGKSDNL